MTTRPLLDVRGLNVYFDSTAGAVHAVRGVSFSMGRERLGIVGESGSGKSATARAILRLPPGRIVAERLEFDGRALLALSPEGMRRIRGRRMAMILQDPRFALNPTMTIEQQIREACRLHLGVGGREGRERTKAMLEAVRIAEIDRVLGSYPHQLSGGMAQRAMIAMMLIGEPDLLIADEATSALDVTVQTAILKLLDEIVAERGMGLLMISHDLPMVSSFCDRVVVMRSGIVVEELRAENLSRAEHPYTRGLLECGPTLASGHGDLPTLEREP